MPGKILSVGYERAGLLLRNWVLERAGYYVLPATSKDQALSLLRLQRCDLVIIAGSIPKEHLAQIVSAAPKGLPILSMFGGARIEAAGISAYMPLLDGPEVMLNTVRQLLAEPMPVRSADAHLAVKPAHHEQHGLQSPYLVFADSNRRLVEVTEEVCGLLGYKREELLGKTVEDITAPNTAPVAELYEQFVQEGFQEGSYMLRHSTGRSIPMRYRAQVFPDGCMAAEWYPFLEAGQKRSKQRA
jgi:PAS domain S-box-containing protein